MSPGSSRLIVAFAAPPDSGRPSDGWISAFVYDAVGGDHRAGRALDRRRDVQVHSRNHVGRQELDLRQERRRDVARPLARASAWRNTAEHRTLRIGDDLAVVGRRPARADAALQHHAVLQPRVDAEVHAVPVLGLLAEVAGERRVGRALTRPSTG